MNKTNEFERTKEMNRESITLNDPKQTRILLRSIKPYQKRVNKDKQEEKTSKKETNVTQHKGKSKASILEFKKELCSRILCEGLIESYGEMLKICYYEEFKNKQIIKNDESHHLSLIRIKYSDNLKFLQEVADMFQRTEMNLAAAAIHQAIEGYKQITEKFRHMDDLSMSIKYTKVIYDLSNQSKDLQIMLDTQFYLGNLFYDLGDHAESKLYYEQAYQNSLQADDAKYRKLVSEKLCNLYRDMAYVNGEVTPDSIASLDKAYEFCKELRNYTLEGKISYSVGNAYQELGMNEKAVDYYNKCKFLVEEYSGVASEKVGEGESLESLGPKVYSGLAFSLQALGMDEAAEENLLKLMQLQNERDYKSLSAATLNLGVMYYKQGKLAEAYENMKHHVDYSNRMGQMDFIDKSRINYGVCIGDWNIQNYVHSISTTHIRDLVSSKVKDIHACLNNEQDANDNDKDKDKDKDVDATLAQLTPHQQQPLHTQQAQVQVAEEVTVQIPAIINDE